MEINDNVHKNLEGFSVRLFDQENRWKEPKEEFSRAEKEDIVDQLVENDRNKQE